MTSGLVLVRLMDFQTSNTFANTPPTASWPRILEILNVNSFLLDWTDFWGRNDPDMLEVWPHSGIWISPTDIREQVGNGLAIEQERTHAEYNS